MLCAPTAGLREARADGFAIPALNIIGLEMARGVVRAADKLRSPLIVQTSVKTVRHYGARLLGGIVAELAQKSSSPVSLHLDHCGDLDLIALCLDCGWTSVMMDVADRPLDENIALTREAVRLARRRGAAVEGELGAIAGIEEDTASDESICVNVAQIRRYVEETGIDMFAPAVGTFHGRGTAPPRIRFDLLEAAARETSVPLVLHGGTGIPGAELQRAIGLGVAKINVSTELKESAAAALRAALSGAGFEPLRAFENVEQAAFDVAAAKILMMGSVRRVPEEPSWCKR